MTEAAIAPFSGLHERIEGVAKILVGPDVSVEGLANGHSHAAVVRFESEDARDRYLPRPAHRDFARQFEPLIDGVTVVDLKL